MKKTKVILLFMGLVVSSVYSQNTISYYSGLIEKDPTNAIAYYNRGTLKGAKNDYSGAIKDFDKAIGLKPIYEKAYINRGYYKRKIKDYHSAVKNLSMALNINPGNIDGYNKRGY